MDTTDIRTEMDRVRADFRELVDSATPESVADALQKVLSGSHTYGAQACVAAVADYVPQKVLASVFEHYRRLLRPAAVRPVIAQGLR